MELRKRSDILLKELSDTKREQKDIVQRYKMRINDLEDIAKEHQGCKEIQNTLSDLQRELASERKSKAALRTKFNAVQEELTMYTKKCKDLFRRNEELISLAKRIPPPKPTFRIAPRVSSLTIEPNKQFIKPVVKSFRSPSSNSNLIQEQPIQESSGLSPLGEDLIDFQDLLSPPQKREEINMDFPKQNTPPREEFKIQTEKADWNLDSSPPKQEEEEYELDEEFKAYLEELPSAEPLYDPSPVPQDNESRYKYCLHTENAVWFEDLNLSISVLRKVEKESQKVFYNLNFTNKSTTSLLRIAQFKLFGSDSKALSVEIMRIPETLSPSIDNTGEMVVSMSNFFVVYCVIELEYVLDEIISERALLKIPINVLMFCEELPLNEEQIRAKMLEWEDSKLAGAFVLDEKRVQKAEQVEEMLATEGRMQLIHLKEWEWHGATQFPYSGIRMEAVISLSLQPQPFLQIFSPVEPFREILVRNLLDLFVESTYQSTPH